MSRRGWEVFPKVREALPEVWEWSRDPPICLLVFGRPSRCPRVVGIFSKISGHFREALLNVQECSGGLSGGPGVDERPSWMSGSGRDALPYVC